MKLPWSKFSARNIPTILVSHLHLSSSPLQGHHHPWTSKWLVLIWHLTLMVCWWVYTSVNSGSLRIRFMNVHRSQPFVCDLHVWTVCKLSSQNVSSQPTLTMGTQHEHNLMSPLGSHTKIWNDTEKISMAPAQGWHALTEWMLFGAQYLFYFWWHALTLK